MSRFENIKRIVVKVGTSSLTHATGLLNLVRIENLVRQLTDIHNRGIEVVLVTSGAIGAGIGVLGYKEKPKAMPEKQACAAVGQVALLHMYQKLFSEYGKITAQILLTRDDMSHRQRFLNARNTFFALLDLGAVPIVNENDAISVEEIKFGDNDTLSAMVASLVEADLLIILSDIDGLYDSNPKDNKDAKLIKFVPKITKEIEAMAGGAGSSLGTGGMATKIKAAKISVASGSSMMILNGSTPNALVRAIEGEEIGTLFQGDECPLKRRKHWLAFEVLPQGYIYIDEGAELAIKNHKSLLAKGIVKVEGKFDEGDPIAILNIKGEKLAHGITSYNSQDLSKILGIESNNIEEVLGYKHYDEVVHRNNMVMVL
ncbi:glutamate 5-kinase [Clostridium polyendosporum]|uniref:Glutamate 5-kinase n=1 Tax=Clostridium polyendosporum TaxID=69208 RepID=A0A919VH59_9CLOT|nr:glutamate 5-kinase [Clostridium polyendosporum]